MFVDWLSVSQYHGADRAREFVGSVGFRPKRKGGAAPSLVLPDALDAQAICEFVGLDSAKHQLRLVKLDHADECIEVVAPRHVAGSFDTSLQVRSHDGWVHVSGNPARWCRPDNLVGFDLDESMAILSSLLSRLGLPPFTVGDELPPKAGELDRAPRWTGAAFSRIDVTENYETGDEALAKLLITEYAGRQGSRLDKNVYRDETAMFHNSRRSVKAYRKAPDMLKHCKESPWTEWAQGRGIVRHEVALKSRLLHDTGLRYWGNCTMGKLIRLFEHETKLLQLRSVEEDPAALGGLKPAMRVTHSAWKRGTDVRALLSRPTFYRHRRAILDTLGQDIADHVATVTPIRRVVDLRPLVMPAEYWRSAA